MTVYKIRGFTLIESLLTLFIMVILAFGTTVIFQEMTKKSLASHYLSEMMAAIELTRLTAISLNQKVSLCGSEDGEKCDGMWHQHRIIKRSDHQMIYKYLPLRDQFLWIFKGSFGNNQYLQFTPNGWTNGQQGSFYLYLIKNSDQKCLHRLTISQSGRTKVQSC